MIYDPYVGPRLKKLIKADVLHATFEGDEGDNENFLNKFDN